MNDIREAIDQLADDLGRAKRYLVRTRDVTPEENEERIAAYHAVRIAMDLIGSMTESYEEAAASVAVQVPAKEN